MQGSWNAPPMSTCLYVGGPANYTFMREESAAYLRAGTLKSSGLESAFAPGTAVTVEITFRDLASFKTASVHDTDGASPADNPLS